MTVIPTPKRPLIAPDLTRVGRLVRLEPLTLEHEDALTEAVRDGDLWTRWYTSVPRPEGVHAMIEQRLAWCESGFMVPFVAVRLSDDVVLGCTSFYNIVDAVPRVSVGYTWNRASAYGSGTNVESKLAARDARVRDGAGAVRALRRRVGPTSSSRRPSNV